MATIVTRAGKGSPLENSELDSNFTNLNTDKLETSGGTLTGNLSFGDNDKAIFGAGSDLQIWHNGSNSVIADVGTGDLQIRAEDFRVVNSDFSATMLRANVGGDVELYHNNAEKLATTSTGIDVTGTVTADGLTVDGLLALGSSTSAPITSSSSPHIYRTDDVGVHEYGDLVIQGRSDSSRSVYVTTGATPANRIKVSGDGDISFYEDTGTTAKFFWDASAESLGIGTSSPTEKLVLFESGATSQYLQFINNSNTKIGYIGQPSAGQLVIQTNDYMGFHTGASYSERMRIASNGDISFYEDTGTTPKFFWDASAERLGIGTSSPSYSLDVEVPSLSTARFKRSGAGNSSQVHFADGNNVDHFIQADAVSGHFFLKTTNAARFYVDNSEAMRIDSSGNVGIGTTSPSKTLDVDGQLRIRNSGATGYALLEYGTSATATNNWHVGSEGDGTYRFYNGNFGAGTERMRITSAGNVGIGTSSPVSALDVVGDIGYNGRLKPTDAGANGTETAPGICVGYDFDTGFFRAGTNIIGVTTGGTERMRIGSTGIVDILGGTIELNGNELNGISVTIADDAVASMTFPTRQGGFLFLTCQGQQGFPQLIFSYAGFVDFGNSPLGASAIFDGGTNMDINNIDTPTGTTGTDGGCTIFLAGTVGTLYVENRTGVSRTWQVTLM